MKNLAMRLSNQRNAIKIDNNQRKKQQKIERKQRTESEKA